MCSLKDTYYLFLLEADLYICISYVKMFFIMLNKSSIHYLIIVYLIWHFLIKMC